jgi:methyl-accepting chemotaxis protein
MEEKACFIPAIKRPWGWVKNDEEVKKMFRFRMSLTKKILFSSLAIILCFTLFMTWMAFGRKKQMYQDKVESIRLPVEVAFSLLNEYEARAQKGEFSREEAQKRAAERLRNFRYSGKEYIWINDLQPKMIMDPYKPEMEGKDLSDLKDPKGKRFVVEMVNICREKGGGLVEYMWPKHEGKEPVDKISYVMLFKPWGWVIGTGIYIDDLQQEMNRVFMTIFLATALILAGSLVFSYWISRSIGRPLTEVASGMNEAAEQVSSAAVQVASASQTLAEGTSEQASGIEETSSSIEEMSAMIRQNADSALEANKLMEETSRVVDEANRSMKNLTTSMTEISTASEETAKIIKTIDEIAFQTNLLALNAAVEAARAGEAGAGFAVVADEVRNLAMRAADAAKNTAELIESTVGKIKNGYETVTKTNTAFSQVAALAKKVGELVGEISAASNEQAQGIEQINRAVSELDKVVQQNAASAEESASAAQEMNAQAEQMKIFVRKLSGLISGAQNGNGAVLHREALPWKEGRKGPAPSSKKGLPGKAAPQPLPVREKMRPPRTVVTAKAKEVRPEEVIPLEGGEFKAF